LKEPAAATQREMFCYLTKMLGQVKTSYKPAAEGQYVFKFVCQDDKFNLQRGAKLVRNEGAHHWGNFNEPPGLVELVDTCFDRSIPENAAHTLSMLNFGLS